MPQHLRINLLGLDGGPDADTAARVVDGVRVSMRRWPAGQVPEAGHGRPGEAWVVSPAEPATGMGRHLWCEHAVARIVDDRESRPATVVLWLARGDGTLARRLAAHYPVAEVLYAPASLADVTRACVRLACGGEAGHGGAQER